MTLANFNSNFNWQLRALKQAAECCGIVPDIPQPPLPPLCFYYLQPSDYTSTSWFPWVQPWQLDGVDGPGSWATYFGSTNWPVDPAYGHEFSANIAYQDQNGSVNCYWAYTFQRSAPPSVTGVDSFGNPVSCDGFPYWCNWTRICEPSCFAIYGFDSTDPFLSNGGTFGLYAGEWSNAFRPIAFNDPTISAFLTAEVQQFYGPGASITVTETSPGIYDIVAQGIYTGSGQFSLITEIPFNFNSLLSLNSITCP